MVRAQCLQSAKDELASGLEETTAQYQARLELCDQLGGGPYDPSIVPAQFVSGISHPFFPHVVGTVRTYQKTTIEGTETVVVEVTDQTKTILGVECMVIRDTVTLNGVLVEDTLDYFAQDVNGNVWYFGELAINYENGEMVDLDGSFIAGTNGAKAGIVMKASPAIGDTYRQEFFLNEAEDAATILSLTGTAVVPFGTYQNCLVTLDFTPISPEDEENKYYAQGIGVVLEIDLESGERLELIDIVQR
ncbi:MAG: hypothetical protein ACKVS6_11465 [Planctomycetota bacterium]